MRLIHRLTSSLLLLLLGGVTALQAGNKRTAVYVFGFAASFNDSTVYFTNIQKIDSAWIDSKTHFLYSRENYSYQLRDYLKEKGEKAPTCVTTFALSQKDVEKKFIKFKKKYTSGKMKYDVKYISQNDFKYSPVQVDLEMVEQQKKEAAAEKKARKEARKHRKAKAKASHDSAPQGKTPAPEEPKGHPEEAPQQ